MKNLRKLLCVVLCLILTAACATAFSTVAFAEGEEETKETLTLEKVSVFDVWTEEIIRSSFTNPHQTTVSLSEEGVVLTFVPNENEPVDPYVTFSAASYLRHFGYKRNAMTGEQATYLVFAIKANEECDGTIEIFAQATQGDSETADYDCTGDWEYVVVDMSWTSLPETKTFQTIRVDWCTGGAVEGAQMTIGFIACFEDEDEAYDFADALTFGEDVRDGDDVATQPDGEDVDTVAQAPETVDADDATEAQDETKAAEGQDAAVTSEGTADGAADAYGEDDGEGVGCASVVSVVSVGLMMLAGCAIVKFGRNR